MKLKFVQTLNIKSFVSFDDDDRDGFNKLNKNLL